VCPSVRQKIGYGALQWRHLVNSVKNVLSLPAQAVAVFLLFIRRVRHLLRQQYLTSRNKSPCCFTSTFTQRPKRLTTKLIRYGASLQSSISLYKLVSQTRLYATKPCFISTCRRPDQISRLPPTLYRVASLNNFFLPALYFRFRFRGRIVLAET